MAMFATLVLASHVWAQSPPAQSAPAADGRQQFVDAAGQRVVVARPAPAGKPSARYVSLVEQWLYYLNAPLMLDELKLAPELRATLPLLADVLKEREAEFLREADKHGGDYLSRHLARLQFNILKDLEATLGKPAHERFLQLRRQQHGLVSLLLRVHPELDELPELQLSKADLLQAIRAARVWQRQRPRRVVVPGSTEHFAGLKAARAEQEAAVLQALSPEQRRKWRELLGAPAPWESHAFERSASQARAQRVALNRTAAK